MTGEDYGALKEEYSRLAERYERRWRRYVWASVRETVRRLTLAPGDSVLDVACGTGALLRALSKSASGLRLSGVDLSPEMLAIARSRLGEGVDVRLARAESLPYGAERFDVVVSSNAFHYIREPERALAEMHRVLRPLGMLVITDWCDDYLACRLCDWWLRRFSRSHHRTYGVESCRALLSGADFQEVTLERYRIRWPWGLMTATAMKGGAGATVESTSVGDEYPSFHPWILRDPGCGS